MTSEDIQFMVNVFQNHHYSFKIKTGKGILPRKHNNVEITNDFLPQQEILCKFN